MTRLRLLAPVLALALLSSLIVPTAAQAADPVATVKAKTQRMSGPALPPQNVQSGWYEVGARLTLVCFKRGQPVKGYYSAYFPGGWDNLWYKVNDGYWVADVDIYTGTNDPVTGECSNGPAAASIDTGAIYTITARNSGLALDVRGGAKVNGTALQQYSGNSSSAQRFRFIANGDGSHRVVSALTDAQVWDVAGGGTANGVRVQTWSWANVPQQRWFAYVAADSAYVTFKPAHVGRCLDVPGGSTSIKVQLQIWDCNNTSSQQFKLTKVGTWAPPPPPTVQHNSQIGLNVTLRVGDSIKSANGKYSLVQQSDGNLVLYGTKALWANGNMRAGSTTTMQGDGNFVSYQGGAARWASNTAGKGGTRLVVQDDGNVVIYTAANKAVWATNTVQGTTPPGAAPTFRLPYLSGQISAGAPHADNAGSGVQNAIDLGPGSDRRVVSIAAGTVYRVACASGSGSYLGVDHGGGWRSTYYHLANSQTGLVGKSVSAGTYLGDAARTTPCGGSASFDHVHLAILKDNKPVAVTGMRFGSYRVYASGPNYHGYWNDLNGGRQITNTGLAKCCLTAS